MCLIVIIDVIILSLIIILLFLFNLNFSFIRINIKGDNISVLEKEEILNDFSEYYHSFLLFKYLKYDIEDINNDLKSKYYLLQVSITSPFLL